MAYIDKINKNNTDYDLQDSKAARSVDGTTSSHVAEADQIHTTIGVTEVDEYFVMRTTAGDASISTGNATLISIKGHTVQTGHTDEVLDMTSQFADSGTTASLTAATWRSYVNTDGMYEFSYDGSDWKLNDTVVTLSNYGIAVDGTVANGDTITVNYTALVIGSLATATPTSFISNGFNQYDSTAGYARVLGNNQYRISGTYTSLGFTTTIGGSATAVTVTDGKFTPTEDGYIYVTGASGDILIALVWSGIRDSDPYEAYEESTITIPTADANSSSLPTASYGMPSVGDVADELSFVDRTYIQRIGHYTYSAQNLETVQALGVDYIYDTSDIYYVLETPTIYTLASSVSSTYEANDFGTERFADTTVTVGASLYYGNNLADKLRNLADIQTIGNGLTLLNGELSAAGGGGGITTLSSSDYNYPTSTPDGISPVRLANGIYKLPQGLKYYTSPINGTGASGVTASNGDVYFVVVGDSSTGYAYVLDASTGTGGVRGKNNMRIVKGARSAGTMNYSNTKTVLFFDDIYQDQDREKINIGSAAATGSSSIAIGSQNMRADSMYGIAIGRGNNTNRVGNYATAIGGLYPIAMGDHASAYGSGANASGGYAVALGSSSAASATNSIALGQRSTASVQGELNIGDGTATDLYNGTGYRLITGVYDGQSAHDAATKGQLDSRVLTNAGAPTTATVGTIGQLLEDTTNGDLYICTDATDPYVWKKVATKDSVDTAISARLDGLSIVSLTQTEYDALTTIDANTLYVITGA